MKKTITNKNEQCPGCKKFGDPTGSEYSIQTRYYYCKWCGCKWNSIEKIPKRYGTASICGRYGG